MLGVFNCKDAAVEWSVLCLLNSFPPCLFCGETMTSLVQIFRFLVGLGLVVAGGFVVSPFVSSVVSTASRENLSRGFLKQNDTVNRTGTLRSTPNSFTVPAMKPEESRVIRQDNYPLESVSSQQEDISVSSQSQPIMPERMPERLLGNALPGMYGAYRTTVEMPPPPLLDGSSSASTRRPQLTRKENVGPYRKIPNSIPQRYRVQDGDDLTGIATRLYGHPQAAAALWQVNADRLSSPEVLPIGFEMIVPPAWHVFGKELACEDGRCIEPSNVNGANGKVHAASMQKESANKRDNSSKSTSGPWLGSPPELQVIGPQDLVSQTSRGTIRVAPGETLASLAQRVYGNANMADAIFDVNRDRLRSPALLVPGTELRLP